MTKLVVSGAQLQCSFGAAPGTLTVTPDKLVTVENQPVANINDFKPTANIAPFGACSSLANPQVASATSAAQGVLTPQPCIPNTTSPWSPGAVRTKIAKQPALTKSSICNCMWAGVITIIQPGTMKTDAK